MGGVLLRSFLSFTFTKFGIPIMKCQGRLHKISFAYFSVILCNNKTHAQFSNSVCFPCQLLKAL